MADILLEFRTRADAYGFLSESRRLAARLMWDVAVTAVAGGWLVRIPASLYDPTVAEAVGRFNGSVVQSAQRR
jgi:hypothetical protein